MSIPPSDELKQKRQKYLDSPERLLEYQRQMITCVQKAGIAAEQKGHREAHCPFDILHREKAKFAFQQQGYSVWIDLEGINVQWG